MTKPMLGHLVLDGEGEPRFGAARDPGRRHDAIACPTDVEICEDPDSGKVSTRAGKGANRRHGKHRAPAAP